MCCNDNAIRKKIKMNLLHVIPDVKKRVVSGARYTARTSQLYVYGMNTILFHYNYNYIDILKNCCVTK